MQLLLVSQYGRIGLLSNGTNRTSRYSRCMSSIRVGTLPGEGFRGEGFFAGGTTYLRSKSSRRPRDQAREIGSQIKASANHGVAVDIDNKSLPLVPPLDFRSKGL